MDQFKNLLKAFFLILPFLCNDAQRIAAATDFSSSLILDLPLDGSAVDMGPYHLPVLSSGTWVPDRNLMAGMALSLNGVNQNSVGPYDARLLPDELTWCAWVNFQNFNSAQLWTMGGGTGGGGGGLQPQAGGLNYADFNGTGFNANFTVNWTNFEVNTWCQIVVSRTTNSCAMFVNGVKVASQVGLTPYAKSQASDWVFGANVGVPLGIYFMYCPVILDTIHTYNRALSDSEVNTLYTDESAGLVPIVSLVVKTVRLNMNQLVSGKTYQLEKTMDFSNWTNVGGSFIATNSTSLQDAEIIGTVAGYYRVVQLP